MGVMKDLDIVRQDLIKQLYSTGTYTVSEVAIVFNVSINTVLDVIDCLFETEEN